jgi:uncharacterized protein (DUF433 family)
MEPIQSDPNIMHGTPCFTGTRVPVQMLFDQLEKGRTVDDFLTGYPTVKRDQVIAVLELAIKRVLQAIPVA